MNFVFNFDNLRPKLSRKYKFDMEFKNAADLEKTLNWAENSDDIYDFLKEMEKFGAHDIDYDPATDFYGFESGSINPKNYITVMEMWRDFFMHHGIDCGDIEEIIEDRNIYVGA